MLERQYSYKPEIKSTREFTKPVLERMEQWEEKKLQKIIKGQSDQNNKSL